MYGEKGAPKGYSTPRLPSSSSTAQKLCQKCGSRSHWTFECVGGSAAETKRSAAVAADPRSVKPVAQTATKLSRTQLLRHGIKQKRTNFEPELTEREIYEATFKQEKAALLAHAHEERKLAKRQREEELAREKKTKVNEGHTFSAQRGILEDSSPEQGIVSRRRKVRDAISSSDDDDDRDGGSDGNEDADSVNSADSLDLQEMAALKRQSGTRSQGARVHGTHLGTDMNTGVGSLKDNRYIAPPTFSYEKNPREQQQYSVFNTDAATMQAEYPPEVPVTSRYLMPPTKHAFTPMSTRSNDNAKDEPLEDV